MKATSRSAPKGALTLLASLATLAMLGCGAQARSSAILNNGDFRSMRAIKAEMEKEKALRELLGSDEEDLFAGHMARPQLKQESSYDGYIVPEEPFSETDQYNYMNAFLIGAKVADTYEYSDECINNIVDAMDDTAFYRNNVTNHTIEMQAGRKDTRFEPFLNVTGLVGGPVADSVPDCYLFLFNVYQVEDTRFQEFNSNWGNFFLSFLFNQMGNALKFQQKFEKIRQNNEQQNYMGTYQEYGDLFYIIWNFEPLEEASLENIDEFVAAWLQQNEWVTDETPPATELLLSTGLKTASRFAHSFGTDFVAPHVDHSKGLFNRLYELATHERVREAKAATKASLERIGKPKVEATTQEIVVDYVNGIFTGVIEVFPTESNPRLCSSNSSQGYNSFTNMFLNTGASWYDLNSEDGRLDFVTDL